MLTVSSHRHRRQQQQKKEKQTRTVFFVFCILLMLDELNVDCKDCVDKVQIPASRVELGLWKCNNFDTTVLPHLSVSLPSEEAEGITSRQNCSRRHADRSISIAMQ